MSIAKSRPLLALILLISTSVLFVQPGAAQGGGNRAALVVRDGNGTIAKKCVAFAEASISGEELLRRSGLTATINYNAGLGGAICSINGYGCAYPKQDCFCKCQGVKCEYWAYWHWNSAAWQYSAVGASSYQVKNGALEGWAWGEGSYGSTGAIPPSITFDDICPQPTATPTSTPTRTPSPSSTPTFTPPATQAAGGSGSGGTTSGSVPEVLFETTADSLASGACAVLRWVTWDAQQVTLDGVTVSGQDRREICPKATQRYVLIATNAAGQTGKELIISVAGTSAQATVTSTPTAPLSLSPASPAQATPVATPPAPSTRPNAAPPMPTPTMATVSDGQASGSVAYAQSMPASSPTRPSLVSSTPAGLTDTTPGSVATSSSTRLPARRQVVPGQPTPTPILMARIDPGGAAQTDASSAATTGERAAVDNSFRMSLLPGYAAYFLMAAFLVSAGAIVAHRRRAT